MRHPLIGKATSVAASFALASILAHTPLLPSTAVASTPTPAILIASLNAPLEQKAADKLATVDRLSAADKRTKTAEKQVELAKARPQATSKASAQATKADRPESDLSRINAAAAAKRKAAMAEKQKAQEAAAARKATTAKKGASTATRAEEAAAKKAAAKNKRALDEAVRREAKLKAEAKAAKAAQAAKAQTRVEKSKVATVSKQVPARTAPAAKKAAVSESRPIKPRAGAPKEVKSKETSKAKTRVEKQSKQTKQVKRAKQTKQGSGGGLNPVGVAAVGAGAFFLLGGDSNATSEEVAVTEDAPVVTPVPVVSSTRRKLFRWGERWDGARLGTDTETMTLADDAAAAAAPAAGAGEAEQEVAKDDGDVVPTQDAAAEVDIPKPELDVSPVGDLFSSLLSTGRDLATFAADEVKTVLEEDKPEPPPKRLAGSRRLAKWIGPPSSEK